MGDGAICGSVEEEERHRHVPKVHEFGGCIPLFSAVPHGPSMVLGTQDQSINLCLLKCDGNNPSQLEWDVKGIPLKYLVKSVSKLLSLSEAHWSGCSNFPPGWMANSWLDWQISPLRGFSRLLTLLLKPNHAHYLKLRNQVPSKKLKIKSLSRGRHR